MNGQMEYLLRRSLREAGRLPAPVERREDGQAISDDAAATDTAGDGSDAAAVRTSPAVPRLQGQLGLRLLQLCARGATITAIGVRIGHRVNVGVITLGREALTMGQLARGKPRGVVVKTYGRGSLLGLLSLPFAFLMASRGMNGWQESAARDMEDDAVVMARRGYRVLASREYGIPRLGITYYKVTYQLADEA